MVFEGARDIAGNDALGEPLDDCGLADTRLADENGVVLGAAAQDLDRVANFVVTADDRVELALARLRREVLAVLLERFELRLRVLIGYARVTA